MSMLRLGVLAAVLTSTRIAEGQTLTGRVTDEANGRAVAGAAVVVFDSLGKQAGSASSDRAGAWTIDEIAPGPGYRIRVERLGYAHIETAPFEVRAGSTRVNLTTREEVIILPGISAQTVDYLGLLNRSSTKKSTVTLLPDDIAERMRRKKPPTPGRLLFGTIANLTLGKADWPLLPRVNPAGGRTTRWCSAVVFIDGRPYFPSYSTPDLEDIVALQDIRGVEVYDHPWFVPTELTTRRNSAFRTEVYQDVNNETEQTLPPMAEWGQASCGAVFIWTSTGLGIS